MESSAAIRPETGEYDRLVTYARERPDPVPEEVVQRVWYDQLFPSESLQTSEGMPVRVISPGWWNDAEGPDFLGAQIQFGGTVRTGDVEVHLDHQGWRQHGHHRDPRYDNVILEVVLATKAPASPSTTVSGRKVACLLLADRLDTDLGQVIQSAFADDYPHAVSMTEGYCAALSRKHGADHVRRFLLLAGEWRLLQKSRTLAERAARAGMDQAVYEGFLTACGYSRYKNHFASVARGLPYERVRQLAREDPMLVETAFLQVGGLLPQALPDETAIPHFRRLAELRARHLDGLRSLPLAWSRTGVRPNNYPERRLSGAARFLARTARNGLPATLDAIWREACSPLERRRAFEALFPSAMGFWAEHCTWTGKRLPTPNAPLGASRIRSIIGNVFLPAGLASARSRSDREMEERVLELFAALPKETGNHVVRIMIPRIFGDLKPPRIDFRTQQGLLQVFQDWCEPNPSCRNCPVISYLDSP
ncbi:MAG: hypothetical protein AMXMBFR82_34270 [Candidatus Hydrogenedentota bacterium]